MPARESQPPGLRIRPAAIEDAEAIAQAHVVSWQETYRGLMPDAAIDRWTVDDRAERWRKILLQPRPPIIVHVAEYPDKNIVGFISGGMARQPAHGFSHEITSLYVMQVAQKSGTGQSLLKRLVEDVRAQGGNGLYAWVLTGNPACGFYQRLGATPITSKIDERGSFRLEEMMYGWRPLPAHDPDHQNASP